MNPQKYTIGILPIISAEKYFLGLISDKPAPILIANAGVNGTASNITKLLYESLFMYFLPFVHWE